MTRKAWASVVIVALGAVGATTCAKSPGGGSSTGGSSGCVPAHCPVLEQCAQAQCQAQVLNCETPCAPFTTCITTQCGACVTSLCADRCSSKKTQACAQCQSVLGACEEQKCLSQMQSCSADAGSD